MEVQQIIDNLSKMFGGTLSSYEKRRIVFWVDKDEEFLNIISEIEIPEVKVHHLTANNSFQTKYLLEEEDTESHYLIYTNQEIDTEDNWLMDTYLYSQSFHADKVSMIIRDLGIDSSLRNIVKKHKKFFGNKERVRKFKAFGIQNFNEESFEVALMSVLCNVKTPNFEEVLKTVLIESLHDEDNKYLEDMAKFIGVQVFWKYVNKYYGYDQDTPSLKKLMTHLTVTALSHSVDQDYLKNLEGFIAQTHRTNSIVFIDRWMHHSEDSEVFDEYVSQIEREINIPDIVQPMQVNEFKKEEVFPYFDDAIIEFIFQGLQARHEDYEEYKSLIRLRRAKHFYYKYQYLYEALYNAVEMYAFKKEFAMGIPKQSMKDMYQSYIDQYYVMDQYYRRFYNAFDQAEQDERLNELQRMVEYIYTDWFMTELNTNWSSSIQEEIKDEWSIDGVTNQKEFFQKYVSSHLRKQERAFVILSDAMRYDIGVEVAEKLESETRGRSEVDAMLSVIPSVTKLGMASLLPNQNTLEWDEQNNVLLNGQSTQGTPERMKHLKNINEDSVALTYDEMDVMGKSGRREFFKGKKLIYIYHNRIDATGDQATTEKSTFEAVDRAVDEIYNIVKMIRDDLSGTNIYITSDHGFIYQRKPLEESDKIEKIGLSINEVKRRYIISRDQQEVDNLLRIPLKGMITNAEEWNAYVPKSTIRFKMKGQGVNFVHGGASLQEVAVPLIKFQSARRGQSHSRETVPVEVKLTNTSRKITNSIFTLDFFQTEKVEGKMKARTVNIYMVDDQGQKISNEEVVIADKSTEKPEERMFKLRFALKTQEYDKYKTYDLLIKDVESGVVLERLPFTISLGITNEFDF
ncbi:BREX-1 system phosphatase PglZ type A [Alkalibacillus haloalkaliphilus]|uniref:BREX-1 system phosphatase PglZ type A n=1 Tax=Alkalibacillus haloalkaliphilus TaxID=94136 RepID=UPI002935D591|nr:BREX-1 system phosphatase PglZ type A [Alkalibacillus haloalkaliphilus]MDV2581668.1 BREX-1 system phosphatase PglZ type A [Alkalibacillus haloalkaliphilus]